MYYWFIALCLTHYQTTNFRLFQTERVCTWPFLNSMKMAESYPNGLKTLWEKEKLLVTSNFSFSPQCFQKAYFPGASIFMSLCGNGLIPFLHPHINRSGIYDLCPVYLTGKNFNTECFTCVFLVLRSFCGTKVKAICQGQILR